MEVRNDEVVTRDAWADRHRERERPTCFRHQPATRSPLCGMFQNLVRCLCARHAPVGPAFGPSLAPRRFYAASKNRDITKMLNECLLLDFYPSAIRVLTLGVAHLPALVDRCRQ